MEKSVKKKLIKGSLEDAANSIKSALGWKDEPAEEEPVEVEVSDEELAKKKKKEKPRQAFIDFAESYRKEIGK